MPRQKAQNPCLPRRSRHFWKTRYERTMSVLLDVNAFIGLCWEQHEFHPRMQAWFRANAQKGWATCAFTQSAMVRISMQPAFTSRLVRAEDIATLINATTAHAAHRVIENVPDFSSVLKSCTGGLVGHRQITDAWLLSTAIANRVRFLTFDRGVSGLLATEKERSAHLILL